MDLVFKRYSSPFLLLDNLIENGKFLEFIAELLNDYQEEQLYEFWLHKVLDKSYEEFKKDIKEEKERHEAPEELNDERVAEIIQESYEIINNFKPC